MNKLIPVTDAELEEILRYCSRGPWALSSTEKLDFYIHERYTLPLRKVVEFPYGVSGYDMRLMALAPELALELLALRKKNRKLKDKNDTLNQRFAGELKELKGV